MLAANKTRSDHSDDYNGCWKTLLSVCRMQPLSRLYEVNLDGSMRLRKAFRVKNSVNELNEQLWVSFRYG